VCHRHAQPGLVLYLSRPLLCLLCGDIGFVYPAMFMVLIGPSLLYFDKVGGVCCMMFIDSY
jgi:hypothetical protein